MSVYLNGILYFQLFRQIVAGFDLNQLFVVFAEGFVRLQRDPNRLVQALAFKGFLDLREDVFVSAVEVDQGFLAFVDHGTVGVGEHGDRARLLRTLDDAPEARRAHPTAEHFWPLLVAAGAADFAPPVQVIEGGITHGVLSMDSYAFGVAAGAL